MLSNCSRGTLMSYTDHYAQLQVEHTLGVNAKVAKIEGGARAKT